MNLKNLLFIILITQLQSCSSGSLKKLFDFDQKLDSINDDEALDEKPITKKQAKTLFSLPYRFIPIRLINCSTLRVE